MAYQGNQIDYKNLNDNLKSKVDKAEGVESQVQALSPKVDNSWQKGVYNDTDITNINNTNASRVFYITGWKAPASNIEQVSIAIPAVNFNGTVKVGVVGNYNNRDAFGAFEYITHYTKISDTLYNHQRVIIKADSKVATEYYFPDFNFNAAIFTIPIVRKPNAINNLTVKVELLTTQGGTFEMLKDATLVFEDLGTSWSGYPWTPQTTSFMQKNQDNIISGSITSKSTFPFILKPDGQRAHTIHKDANSNLFIAPTAENGNAEWGLATVFALDGTVHMPKLLVDGVDLKQSVSNGKSQVANAITQKGVPTSADAEFATMANNIGQIQTGTQIKAYTQTVTIPALSSGQTASVNVVTPFKPTDAMINLDGVVLRNTIVQGNNWANRHSVYNVRVVDAGGGNWSTFFDIRGGQLSTGEQTQMAMLISW